MEILYLIYVKNVSPSHSICSGKFIASLHVLGRETVANKSLTADKQHSQDAEGT